jgi:hypothetical protein
MLFSSLDQIPATVLSVFLLVLGLAFLPLTSGGRGRRSCFKVSNDRQVVLIGISLVPTHDGIEDGTSSGDRVRMHGLFVITSTISLRIEILPVMLDRGRVHD